ncbi:hypothetical protein BDP55DRAFT_568371 [Colletotrichum godetiae]|uniref:C2H2-type domain-containing protein n=1 Tax=Colletotrichum godetiae TaxID=1209918 RepID=A0AAJ0EKX5_9PEZI|nr:uncharacterized protein BDP55DRAFT_568371 [Colletotrichum godetiae]KAK1656925.1 hypothetical protein BDP55DRAFT_568371 [Colletotrichum godetiae]
MDASQYLARDRNTTSVSYLPHPAIISRQLQRINSPLPHQTLPPLQPQTITTLDQMHGSNPRTLRTSATPKTPGPRITMLPYQPQQQQPRGPYQHTGQRPAPPQAHGTQSMLPQTTMGSAHSQPIAPAPTSGHVSPVLDSMPASGAKPRSGMTYPHGAGDVMSGGMDGVDQPQHVVGSCGRREILPSAPGRPAATPASTGNTKSTVIPARDADGKFPCPHCIKTYLHAKHLKRHLLRHTGERPYGYVKCGGSFSRSDILKCHSQKCLSRRSNSIGASHLSRSAAHVEKESSMENGALGQDGGLNHLSGPDNVLADGTVQSFGMMAVPDRMNHLAKDQSQLSCAGSFTRLGDGSTQDGKDSIESAIEDSGPVGKMQNSTMGLDQDEKLSNGEPRSGKQSKLDRTQIRQAVAQRARLDHAEFAPNRPAQTRIATDLVPTTGVQSRQRPPAPPNHRVSFFLSTWNVPPSIQSPFSFLSDRILSFLLPLGTPTIDEYAGFNLYFSAENVREFLETYTHVHTHSPFFNTPAFRIMDAYAGLLIGMCCFGACNSNHLPPDHVRDMIDTFTSAPVRDLLFLDDSVGEKQNDNVGAGISSYGQWDLEKAQAIALLDSLMAYKSMP